MRGTLEERFWAKVQRGDGCWLWTGGRTPPGYGHIHSAGHGAERRIVYAHRLSYELHHGPIPDGLLVRHTCDTPACVRPNHLVVGTFTDNSQDRERRRRSWWFRNPSGFRRHVGVLTEHRSKLTPEAVSDLRVRHRAGESFPALARELGVTPRTVWSAFHGHTWATVPQFGEPE